MAPRDIAVDSAPDLALGEFVALAEVVADATAEPEGVGGRTEDTRVVSHEAGGRALGFNLAVAHVDVTRVCTLARSVKACWFEGHWL